MSAEFFSPNDIQKVVEILEPVVGHNFHNQKLLLQSLTHSSYSNERGGSVNAEVGDNERLEFLGDAVLGLVIADALMERFPSATEGQLSKWRSALVSRRTLAEAAHELKLGELMFLGRGERRTGGSAKPSILASTFEALIGAVYLDGGLSTARKFLEDRFGWRLDKLLEDQGASLHVHDRKTHLQERIQGRFRVTPIYRLVESWGPEHEKFFKVEILVEGRVVAHGEGRSKKDAEQEAARLALEILGF